jgi:hypothetical protein
MRSTRLLVEDVAIDGVPFPTRYADVFVVVREGEEGPGSSDWEATLRTTDRQKLQPGIHILELVGVDGTALSGRALLRFSDGHTHLFRGDGHMAGWTG